MLILPKAHILDMSRKLSQRQNGITSDGRDDFDSFLDFFFDGLFFFFKVISRRPLI